MKGIRFALLPSFDSEEPEFYRGFEAGGIWQELHLCDRGGECRHVFVVKAENAEMVLRIAENTGHSVVSEAEREFAIRVAFTRGVGVAA